MIEKIIIWLKNRVKLKLISRKLSKIHKIQGTLLSARKQQSKKN
jgi:hypothetical protein